MSDVFKNIDYGNQAQGLVDRNRVVSTKIAAEVAKRDARGNIEKNVGLLKASLGGKQLTEGLIKGLKPYAKQEGRRALNSAKDGVEKFAARWSARSNNLVEQTASRDALQATHQAAETERLAAESQSQAEVDGAAEAATASGASTAEAEAATAGAVSKQVAELAANNAARATESGAMSDANAAVGTAQAEAGVSDRAAAQLVAKAAEKATAKAAEKVAAKAAGEATGEEVGEITGTEAIGAALDSTGIGAPLGILIGALGIGLGARQESAKHQPKMPPQPINEGGATFQAGIN